MITHTEGPWTFKYEPQSDGSAEAFEIHAHGTTLIGACSCCNGAFISDDAEGNARLISAAPDLLEALIEVAASLAWNAHGECRAIHDGPIMPSNGALEMAKAAIAKARGEK